MPAGKRPSRISPTRRLLQRLEGDDEDLPLLAAAICTVLLVVVLILIVLVLYAEAYETYDYVLAAEIARRTSIVYKGSAVCLCGALAGWAMVLFVTQVSAAYRRWSTLWVLAVVLVGVAWIVGACVDYTAYVSGTADTGELFSYWFLFHGLLWGGVLIGGLFAGVASLRSWPALVFMSVPALLFIMFVALVVWRGLSRY